MKEGFLLATETPSKGQCPYCGGSQNVLNGEMCIACAYELYDYEPSIHDQWRFGWSRKNGKKVVYLQTRVETNRIG